jgi:alkanesulfonate monooxygenase SsuD/methylene tetrahydromethanopterin reductase-like flavin-dependent oxidoreductase (luciferase family)
LAGRIGDGVVLSAGLSTASVRQSIAVCAEGAAKEGRDLTAFRRAGYLFFAASHDAKQAIDAVRQKLAFVMRNKFLGANIKESGIPVDQEAVIAAHEAVARLHRCGNQ